MCAIAGYVSYNGKKTDNKTLIEMQNSLTKRGPDDNGIFRTENADLVHTRLSVVDLENGKQPMSSQGYTVVYNGELYNTEEIRHELINKGYKFNGHSDTEVLLKSYIEWKESCVEKFNGIFAFAIYDSKNKKLFFARDRIGVKPFFYKSTNEEFIFASEIKALLCHPSVSSNISLESVSDLILLGPGRTPGYGVFNDIKELEPACCGTFSADGLKIFKYWSLEDKEFNDSFDETVGKVKYLISDAITRQLVSDVKVCTFLSGGLDSSIISSVAANYMKQNGKRLTTLSVDYKDNDKYFKTSTFQPDADNKYIKIMSDYLGTEHHNIVIDTDSLIDALYKAVDARDLPGMADVDSSLLLFCNQVKNYATVALSGECADEIFGGYPWYQDENIRNLNTFPWSKSTEYRSSFIKKEILASINPEKYVSERYNKTIKECSKCIGLTPLESRMKEMMHLNLSWFMQTLLDPEVKIPYTNGMCA